MSHHATEEATQRVGRLPARWARRQPLVCFWLLTFVLGWPLTALPALTDHDLVPGPVLPLPVIILAVTFGVLLPSACLVTWLTDGRAGVRRLLAAIGRWRLAPGSWLLATVAVPATAALLGALTGGTITLEPTGLAGAVASAVVALVVVHLVEELVWAGFVQLRLTASSGPVRAALLTALPFAALHLPLTLLGPVTAPTLLINTGGLLLLALVLRALVGLLMTRTAGSVLAAAAAHASFNSANNTGGLVDSLVSGTDQGLLAPTATALLVGMSAIPLARRRRVASTSLPTTGTTRPHPRGS